MCVLEKNILSHPLFLKFLSNCLGVQQPLPVICRWDHAVVMSRTNLVVTGASFARKRSTPTLLAPFARRRVSPATMTKLAIYFARPDSLWSLTFLVSLQIEEVLYLNGQQFLVGSPSSRHEHLEHQLH
jgi:hypothetical protein